MSLKILTLNLWHDQGPWERRCDRIRQWLDRLEPDVVALQEVLRGPARDQLAELFHDRPFHLAFAAATPFWRDPSLAFGNAVASRFPLGQREVLELPDSGDGEKRVALSVAVETPHGLLGLTCTHLNWKLHQGCVRERQAVALAAFARARRPSLDLPPVIAGDLNAEPDATEIRYLTGLQSLEGRSVLFYDAWRIAGDGGPGFTWSNRNPYARVAIEPDRRIDYVLAGYPQPSGIGRIETCRVVCDDEQDGVWPTDHFGVLAEIRTEPLPGLGSWREAHGGSRATEGRMEAARRVVRLYDSTIPSGNGYKVRLLLAHQGQRYERVLLDLLRGETRTPEYLARNPNGKIPLVELDDGSFLAESNAILVYLAEGTPHWPESRLARARCLQWMFFEQYSHEPNIATSRFWYYSGQAAGREAALAEKHKAGHAALGVMERHLAGEPFFVGERYSVADIALYAYTHVAHEGGFDLAPYPSVRAWLERVRSQPRHETMT